MTATTRERHFSQHALFVRRFVKLISKKSEGQNIAPCEGGGNRRGANTTTYRQHGVLDSGFLVLIMHLVDTRASAINRL